MQANQTQTLTYLMTLPTPFLVDTGSVTLKLTKPDGSVVSSISGTFSPNTISTSATLSAVYTPLLGGLWKALWSVTVAGVSYTYPATFWVVWTDIYDAVRVMLGSGNANVADSILDREFRNLDTELRDYAPTLPPYYLFNVKSNPSGLLYSDGYDQGIAKLLSAKVRPYIGGKRPTGEVSLFKKGTTTVQYTEGQPRSEFTIEQEWYMQGMRLLEANIPEIYAVAVNDREGDEVMTRGQLSYRNRHRRYDECLDEPYPGAFQSGTGLTHNGDF